MSTHIVRVNGDYHGALRCVATHGPSGATLETDAPKDNEGRGESFSPTDLVSTALGTCICTILGIVARRRELDVAGMRFVVDKEMVNAPRRRIGKLTTTIHLPAALDKAARAALERAARACPVHASLHPDVEAPVTFVYA